MKGEGKDKVVVFDVRKAFPALVALGVDEDEIDHIVEVSDLVGSMLAEKLDDFMRERSVAGLCMHPESICLAIAVLAEKFVPARLEPVGAKALDPVACIEVVRKFTEVEIDEDVDEDVDDDEADSEAETPRPVTVH